jgi:hypothetical protein
MEKSKHEHLIEDLIVTGDHSILVNYVTREERIKHKKIRINEGCIDDKYLVMSCVSSLFKQITDTKDYVYYHFCVEEENEVMSRKYGVWSNGMLSEIPAVKQFKHLNLRALE